MMLHYLRTLPRRVRLLAERWDTIAYVDACIRAGADRALVRLLLDRVVSIDAELAALAGRTP